MPPSRSLHTRCVPSVVTIGAARCARWKSSDLRNPDAAMRSVPGPRGTQPKNSTPADDDRARVSRWSCTAPHVPHCMMRIAVDAMGGNFAPGAVVEGALVAARHLGVGLALVGDATLVRAELARHPGIASLDIEVLDAPEAVGMGEAPAALAAEAPSVSQVGGRGGCRAVTRLRSLAPATQGPPFWPLTRPSDSSPASIVRRLRPRSRRLGRPAILLDAGANAECRAQHLVQFALMGAVYATISLRVTRPRVALLSIGEEATKGNDLTIEAHRLLKTAPVDFIGNVEARELFAGPADVIVCDGFTGNVALKVSEGLVEVCRGAASR